MKKKYPRNMLGYGSNSPEVKWPNNSRIAVQFVLNYEEGGENCVLHGDKYSEVFLSEIIAECSINPNFHLFFAALLIPTLQTAPKELLVYIGT